MDIGITICPHISVQEDLVQKNLSTFECEAFDDTTSVIMIWHSQKWCSPILKQFLDLSKKIIYEPTII